MTNLKKDPQLVLVVEDDQDIRETLLEALESEGYRVQGAHHGREGLDYLRKHAQPGLVLLDMMMPVMDGREFLNVLMADPELSQIPVFIVSAIADRANTTGAVGFIKKPADLDEILTMVARYCERPS